MKQYQKLNQLIKIYKISIEENEALVVLDEEFGYKQYIWKPEMSCNELERWWKRQHHMGWERKSSLPGKVLNINDILYEPPMKQFESTEEFLKYLDDNIFFNIYFERWHTLNSLNLCYRSMIFSDDYSYLLTPSGRYIHHMGWWPAKLQTEKDIQEQRNSQPTTIDEIIQTYKDMGCKFAEKGFRVNV